MENHQPYDILIIDFYMPDLYGKEVILLCRNFEKEHAPANFRTRMILTSTDDDKDVISGATAAGADEFLFKPVSLEKFKKVLNL